MAAQESDSSEALSIDRAVDVLSAQMSAVDQWENSALPSRNQRTWRDENWKH